MLAKTQIIDRKLDNSEKGKKRGLNKTQIINQNNANELIMNNSEEGKKNEISSDISGEFIAENKKIKKKYITKTIKLI